MNELVGEWNAINGSDNEDPQQPDEPIGVQIRTVASLSPENNHRVRWGYDSSNVLLVTAKSCTKLERHVGYKLQIVASGKDEMVSVLVSTRPI